MPASPASSVLLRALPWALACLVLVLSLRGARDGGIYETDAARHAMNGAFVHDLVRDGGLRHPMRYARVYYSRLPALSLPYHPPVFPAVEALAFSLVGVHALAARAVVALAAAAAALLLYRLVLTTHASAMLAALAVAAVFSLRWTRLLSMQVMLEMPALAFCLAALTAIATPERMRSVRNGLLFGVLAGAALWTKQSAAFLGAVPIGYIVLTRRWALLREPATWVATGVFGILVAGWIAVSLQVHNTGIDYLAPWDVFGKFVARNLGFYARTLRSVFGISGMAVAAAAVAILLFLRRPASDAARPGNPNLLYVAWALAALAVPLVTHHSTSRYVFFVLPPTVVLGCALLFRTARSLMGPRWGRWATTVTVGVFCVLQGDTPVLFTRGPEAVAARIVDGQARRILYCGVTDGHFVLAVRSRDPNLNTVVIRGDKLPDDTFDAETLTAFLRDYGISHLVVERSARPAAWDTTEFASVARLAHIATEPLHSSMRLLSGGELRVYRFDAPSANPARRLNVRLGQMGDSGSSMGLDFSTNPRDLR
jgi:hypothetical protein